MMPDCYRTCLTVLLTILAAARGSFGQQSFGPDPSCAVQLPGTGLEPAAEPVVALAQFDPETDNVTIVVTSPVYWERGSILRYTSSHIRWTELQECRDTGTVYTGTGASCLEILTISQPLWTLLDKCRFDKDESVPGVVKYSAMLRVRWTDVLPALQNTEPAYRYLSWEKEVSFTFPTTVMGSTGLNTTGGPGQQFTVTQLTFNAGSGGAGRTLTLDYTLANDFPFVFTLDNTTAPTGLILAGQTNTVFDPPGCGSGSEFPVNSQCVQTATVTYNIPATTCNLQGVYRFGYTSSCVDGICSNSSHIFSVDVGNYPICSVLNQTITGVTGSLVANSSSVLFGNPVSMLLNISSPNKKLVRVVIQEAFIASSKHSADPGWANRTLVAGNALATLGSSLSFSSSNGLVQNSEGGANEMLSTLSFNTNAATSESLGLLKISDLSTGNNAFTVYLSIRLYFDSLGLPARRGRRRRLEYRDRVVGPEETESVLKRIEFAVRDTLNPHPIQRRYLPSRAVKVKVAAQILLGKLQSLSSGLSIDATNVAGPNKNLTTAAIVGMVIGILLFAAVIFGIVAWGVKRKRRTKLIEESFEKGDMEKAALAALVPVTGHEPKKKERKGREESSRTLVADEDDVLDAEPIAGPALRDWRTSSTAALAVSEMESAIKSSKRAKKEVALDSGGRVDDEDEVLEQLRDEVMKFYEDGEL